MTPAPAAVASSRRRRRSGDDRASTQRRDQAGQDGDAEEDDREATISELVHGVSTPRPRACG